MYVVCTNRQCMSQVCGTWLIFIDHAKYYDWPMSHLASSNNIWTGLRLAKAFWWMDCIPLCLHCVYLHCVYLHCIYLHCVYLFAYIVYNSLLHCFETLFPCNINCFTALLFKIGHSRPLFRLFNTDSIPLIVIKKIAGTFQNCSIWSHC